MKISIFQTRVILVKSFAIFFLITVLSACQTSIELAKNITVSTLFSDNMVLQQKQEIPVWGSAEPGGEVTVILNDEEKKSIVDQDGKWSVNLSPVTAGGPYELLIKGEKTIKIKNVLVGEVWICSGQSNMEMPVSGDWAKVLNDSAEVANANHPNIRLFQVEKVMANTPQNKLESQGWKECSPGTVANFSAIAYFYGRYLQKELDVPVGLIQTAWGGTVVEAWTSGKTLKKFDEFKDIVAFIENDKSTTKEKKTLAKKKLNEWPDKIENILKSEGTLDHGYQNLDHDVKNWKLMKLPTVWEDLGLDIDGVVWFSKEINIPASWKGEDLTLSLGGINDYDITWFNGKRVGRGVDAAIQRVYKTPASIVNNGKNRITVQVLDIGNVGGLYGPAKNMKISSKSNSISLAGNWTYKIDPIKIDISKLPEKPDQNSGVNRPSVLYNAMIYPLLPYGIKGVIWYQGESNAERAYQYRGLFSTMIKDWRNDWGQGDFPFYFVQLANFKKIESQPVEDSWAELREAQNMALKLPNTGVAVTIDIGNAKDIHPKNKQDVSKRLALSALAKTYKKDISFSGPMYKSMKIEGDRIKIQFDHTDGGLSIKDDKELKGFAIAGKDKIFIWAKVKIVGDQVIVWNSKIKDPVAVRYAWAANPVCNLYNKADLPASPFRTDDWKGKTYGKK